MSDGPNPQGKHARYTIEGNVLTRAPMCPNCPPGVFLGVHSDRPPVADAGTPNSSSEPQEPSKKGVHWPRLVRTFPLLTAIPRSLRLAISTPSTERSRSCRQPVILQPTSSSHCASRNGPLVEMIAMGSSRWSNQSTSETECTRIPPMGCSYTRGALGQGRDCLDRRFRRRVPRATTPRSWRWRDSRSGPVRPR